MIDQLVIPCAGKGTRFKPFTNTPKFLIPVDKRPLLKWSARSMTQTEKYKRIVIIVHSDQNLTDRQIELTKLCVEELSDTIHIVVQSTPLKGAADTISLSRPFLDPRESVIIFNSDQYCPHWNRDLEHAAGHIIVFKEPTKNPKWSYAKLDKSGSICEVAEKKAISDLATVGGYIFSSAGLLFEGLDEMFKSPHKFLVNGELYLAPVYNLLMDHGLRIAPIATDESFAGLGTPEDLDTFCIAHKLPTWRQCV